MKSTPAWRRRRASAKSRSERPISIKLGVALLRPVSNQQPFAGHVHVDVVLGKVQDIRILLGFEVEGIREAAGGIRPEHTNYVGQRGAHHSGFADIAFSCKPRNHLKENLGSPESGVAGELHKRAGRGHIDSSKGVGGHQDSLTACWQSSPAKPRTRAAK